MARKHIENILDVRGDRAMIVINSYKNTVGGIPRDGLIGEWLFNGDALDTSGNGYHGTVNGAVLTTDRKGVSNAAYNFLPNIRVIHYFFTGTGALSLSIWFRRTIETGVRTMFYHGNVYSSGKFAGLQVYMFGNILRFGTFIAANGYIEIPLVYNTDWNNFIITKPANGRLSDMSFYLNNIKQTPTIFNDNFVINIENTTDRTIIGSMNSKVNAFLGDLDDIRFYNRELNVNEIGQLYNE